MADVRSVARRFAAAIAALAMAGGFLGWAGRASAALVVVDQAGGPTPVSAFGGWALWSRYDPTRGGWRLVAGRGVAPGRVLAHATTRSSPFDADLGPDPHGRVVAVWSREGRLVEAGLRAGAERPLPVRGPRGWRLAWPAISGARVVAVARRAGDSRLVAGRLGGALRPVPGGPRGAALSHLDLAGGRMVYLAERRDGSRAVVLRPLGRDDSAVLARSRPGSDTELLSPSLDAGAAVWGALVLSSGPTAPRPCSCVADASLRPLRRRPATSVCTYGNLVGLARSRGVLHLSDDLGTVAVLPRGAAPC